MQENWIPSFNTVMASESGFQNDPRDPGNALPDGRQGCTMLGVTQKNWEHYVGRKVTQDDMRALTKDMVRPFYKINYWNAVHGDSLPTGVDYLCFDIAVNAGPVRAAKLLQTALGIEADGIIGQQTMNNVALADKGALIDKFTAVKTDWYRSLNNPTFEKGWLARSDHAATVAHGMAHD